MSERAELTRHLVRPAGSNGSEVGSAAVTLLSREDCLGLLAGQSVGRLAYIARLGVPDIVPVNYVLDGEDVLIRSGPGPKLQAAERLDSVAFEVDALDLPAGSGWSVVVHGSACRLTLSQVRKLRNAPEPWAEGPRHHVIRIRVRRITGRRIGAAGPSHVGTFAPTT